MIQPVPYMFSMSDSTVVSLCCNSKIVTTAEGWLVPEVLFSTVSWSIYHSYLRAVFMLELLNTRPEVPTSKSLCRSDSIPVISWAAARKVARYRGLSIVLLYIEYQIGLFARFCLYVSQRLHTRWYGRYEMKDGLVRSVEWSSYSAWASHLPYVYLCQVCNMPAISAAEISSCQWAQQSEFALL